MAGCDPDQILALVDFVTGHKQGWRIPPEYLAENVSDTVCRLLLGYRTGDLAGRDWAQGTKP